MSKTIKTENIIPYIGDHCSNVRLGTGMPLECALKDELIVCDNELQSEDWLYLEIESKPSTRCILTEYFSYRILPYDSISVKCVLENHSASVVSSQH